MKIKIIILINLIFASFSLSAYAVKNNSILVKVGNEIITSHEVKNKILTNLVLNNKEINQENINKQKSEILDVLITQKLKKIELSKYKISAPQEQINKYLSSFNSGNLNDLKEIFNNNNLNFELFYNDIETELSWQNLIYNLYSKNIQINEKMIDQEIEEAILKKKDIIQYRISEIEFTSEKKDQKQKIINVRNRIKNQSFESAAKELSISTTSVNGGDLGWINKNSLSKEIYLIISKMRINDISDPIINPNSIIFLKLTDKKISKSKNINKTKLKQNIINQKRNELFNLYSRSHLSKLKNNTYIEYK